MIPDLGALCQSCGLCCDGTLFTRVPLRESEFAPAAVKAVTTPTNGRYLPQPCAALEGSRCSCYGERPQACRGFECTLLWALKDGEVFLEEAQALVARSKTLSGQAQQSFLRFHFGRHH